MHRGAPKDHALTRLRAYVSPGDMDREWPACQRCQTGKLLPLSDYGRDGAPIMYKAWACDNPDCGFNLRIDNGELSYGRTVGVSQK